MRRKAVIFSAVTLCILLILWLSPSLSQPQRTLREDYDNPYIFKGPKAEDKVLVLAKIRKENVDWVQKELPDWQHAIYHMDDPTWILHPPANKGHEAMAYLTFIIAHYHDLPSIMVFLHPHRKAMPQSWHNDAEDYDNVKSVRSLRLDYVRQHGYANLRCAEMPGCPDEIQPFRGDPDYMTDVPFADAYVYLFGGNYSTVPHTVAAACCAQFAVSKAQVLVRPRSDYLRYRQWLLDTDLHDEISGRVMEYLWHIIFGKDPVWCPDAAKCLCEQFGRCGGI